MYSSPSPSFIQDLPDELSPSRGRMPTLFDPPTEALAIKVVEGVFVSLMLIAVAVRLYVRAAITKRWRADDYTCILATCGSMVHTIMTIQLIEMDSRRQWDNNSAAISFRIWFANSKIYPWTAAFGRISILLLCLRAFGAADKRIRQAIWAAFIFQVVFAAGIQIVGVAREFECGSGVVTDDSSSFCRHVARALDSIINTFNVFCDCFVVIMPMIWYLWTKPTFWRKVGAVGLYCFGILFFGLDYLRQSDVRINENGPDFLRIATIIQINTLIIFACVSTFPALYNHLLSSLRFSSKISHTHNIVQYDSPGPDSRSRSSSGGSNSSNFFEIQQGKGKADEGEMRRDADENADANASGDSKGKKVGDYSTFIVPESKTKKYKKGNREAEEGGSLIEYDYAETV